ncbi:MAG: hypothetical protein WAM39_22335 [Bryobacteraceae bacterium]
MAPVSRKPDSTWYLLGKYVGLAFLLPSSAAAGYLLGRFIEHYVHWSGWVPAGIIVGVVAGLIKLLQELLRDSQ